MRILAAWLLSAALGAAFIALTSIGPVVYSMGWRHGVHATDVAVVAGLLAWCSWLTWRTWAKRRRPAAAEAATPNGVSEAAEPSRAPRGP